MEWTVDKSGALAVKFSEGKYIHVLPFTKYQFERFIWETAPSWCDYEKVIEETGRVSPHKIDRKNLSCAFLTNINFDEARKISNWLGARLPVIKEWKEAYECIFTDDRFFEKALKCMTEAMRHRNKIDRRIFKLLEALSSLGIKRWELGIGELVSEFSAAPYGRIYLKLGKNQQAMVTGSSCEKTRHKSFGFCAVSG